MCSSYRIKKSQLQTDAIENSGKSLMGSFKDQDRRFLQKFFLSTFMLHLTISLRKKINSAFEGTCSFCADNKAET